MARSKEWRICDFADLPFLPLPPTGAVRMGAWRDIHFQRPDMQLAVPQMRRLELRFGGRCAGAAESGKMVSKTRNSVRDDAFGSPRTVVSVRFHVASRSSGSEPLRPSSIEKQSPGAFDMLDGYHFLGKDWLEAAKRWKKEKQPTPPVMITVANTTHTAARVEFAFTRRRVNIDELCDAERVLHIDSRVLAQAEEEDEPVQLGLKRAAADEEPEEADGTNGKNGADGDRPKKKLTKKEQAELLRPTGGHSRTCRSGWRKDSERHFRGHAFRRVGCQDRYAHHGASRVHVAVALRAGGRARIAPHVLRGRLKTGFFQPEYVNIFGVPFTFLPHEGGGDEPPPPPSAPKTRIESLPERKRYEITWPKWFASITSTARR